MLHSADIASCSHGCLAAPEAVVCDKIIVTGTCQSKAFIASALPASCCMKWGCVVRSRTHLRKRPRCDRQTSAPHRIRLKNVQNISPQHFFIKVLTLPWHDGAQIPYYLKKQRSKTYVCQGGNAKVLENKQAHRHFFLFRWESFAFLMPSA